MVFSRARLLVPLLTLVTLGTLVPAPSAHALDPLSKLHEKLFGDGDDGDKKRDKGKDKDKEKRKKKEREEEERRRSAAHEHYDRDRDGYCDYCGKAIVVVRQPGVIVERRPYGEPPPPPRYGYGSELRNSSVESDVQSALRRRGYYRGPSDGEFGPGTRDAIRNFQYDYGLPVSGRIDPTLLRYLGI